MKDLVRTAESVLPDLANVRSKVPTRVYRLLRCELERYQEKAAGIGANETVSILPELEIILERSLIEVRFATDGGKEKRVAGSDLCLVD